MSIPMNMLNPVASQDEGTTRAQEVKMEQNAPSPTAEEKLKEEAKAKVKKRNTEFRQRVDYTKQYRKQLIGNWIDNIDRRRGKPYASQTDDEQTDVNPDWGLTKVKNASLFSQVPQVRVSHHPQSATAGPWLAQFEGKLNDLIVQSGIEAAMDEAIPDCINASGIGVVLVSYETITADKEVPTQDPMLAEGGPMETVPQVVDRRYIIQRISPSDFLWPLSFTGSNFDNASWVGRSGRITWSEALQKGWVKEEEKNSVIGEDRNILDKLTNDIEKEKIAPDQMVGFDEVFYKEYQYDDGAQSFSTIHHLVFISGKDEPVIDEPWRGQEMREQGLVGATKYPIRVLTLAYISDDSIPPSDTAVGRPQVNELNKSRRQMIMQRARSLPVRWYDVNRVDPAIQQALMKGTWQHMIPVQGDGDRILGEVARAVMPQEDFTFDQITKNDLNEVWSIGPNQVGSGKDVETKGESSEIANNFKTREGRERAKVASFFVGISEVLGGIMCLFEDPQLFGEGFDPSFSKSLAFSILADSTVLLDANQKLQRMNAFLNTYAKSGWVNLEPVLKEIAILSGLDPNTVIRPPMPKEPEKPSVSLRLTGAEDMMNPLLLAYVLNEGKPPDNAAIDKAKALIQYAVMPPPVDPMTGQPLPPGGQPQGPPGGPGAPTPVGEANPDMTILPKIAKRSDDPSAGGKE